MDIDLSFDDSEFQTSIVPLDAMPDLIEASKAPCSNGNPCGRLNGHVPCSRKVGVLTKLARLNVKNEWVRIEAGRTLIGQTTMTMARVAYRADQHAYRLKWLGLVRKLAHRDAQWQIRPEAILFLRGELSIPAKVLVNHGNVYYASEEQMFVSECDADLDKAYWDAYAMGAFDDAD